MKDTNTKIEAVRDTAKELVAGDKGLLAMDESNPTCNKRFAQFGIPQTPEARCAYREMIVTTPGLGKYISGAILYDETIRQHTSDGRSFIDILVAAGIIPGIKVDMGTVPMAGFPGEKITEGLDGLATRLNEYAGMGLRFAKWRAVIAIGKGIPTPECIAANMQTLAQYAFLCQEAGVMPIIEPEVLMDGEHGMSKCFEITGKVLRVLFDELTKRHVDLTGMLLKPNMILPGTHSTGRVTAEEVADATVECLLRYVPVSVTGIVFLSGGQISELASLRLNQMNQQFKDQLPWKLSFSFSRAIQLPALKIWKGNIENKIEAQNMLRHRDACNSAACSGEYTVEMETLIKQDKYL